MGTFTGKCRYCGEEMILRIGQMVVDGEIQQARVSVDGTVITIKGGEKIKVTRSMKYEQGENI